jgi:hypothetical protein
MLYVQVEKVFEDLLVILFWLFARVLQRYVYFTVAVASLGLNQFDNLPAKGHIAALLLKSQHLVLEKVDGGSSQMDVLFGVEEEPFGFGDHGRPEDDDLVFYYFFDCPVNSQWAFPARWFYVRLAIESVRSLLILSLPKDLVRLASVPYNRLLQVIVIRYGCLASVHQLVAALVGILVA